VIASPRHPDPVASRPAAAPAGGRAGFSLVELLVVMSIMVVLVGLVSAAVAGARSSQKKQATRLLISKLDAIVQQQMATYAARVVPPAPGPLPADWTKAAYRSWYIRRNLITGDLPDRWSDVAALASGTVPLTVSGNAKLPVTAPQRTYAAVLSGLARRDNGGNTPSPAEIEAKAVQLGASYAGAECLFMIVMQGGIADCIDCGELRTADRGDKDGDGLFEFWDAWGNPIGFILWPAGLQLPGGSGATFFAGSRALENPFPPPSGGIVPSPALGMRPLIYSAGPDEEYGFNRGNEVATLTAPAGASPAGKDCGNPAADPTATMAQPEGSVASDNLTNLDAEAVK
jgi:prepilin-type N-terminal cleavage/methylation domain-containing protein